MESTNLVDGLPGVPGIYAMYGGKGRQYVAYVGMADNLRRRVKQHLVNRDSSVTTGTGAVGLNPDYVRAVVWWVSTEFADRTVLAAAELVAFDLLDPALRSRGTVTAAAAQLARDAEFRGRVEDLLASPSGRIDIPGITHLADRLASLEQRVARLEESQYREQKEP